MNSEQKKYSRGTSIGTADLISHKLSRFEAMLYITNEPRIHTLTWFKGDFHAAGRTLEKRMKVMIQKNPWLQGRISVTSFVPLKCHLSYKRQTYVDTKDYLTMIDPTESPFSRDTPLDQLLHIMQENTQICIKNGPKEPIVKVTVIPCATKPKDSFALSFQLSHVVGDGATYYKLLHMLCSTSGDTIVELIPDRILESDKLQIAAIGKDEYRFLFSLGMTLTLVLCKIMNAFRGSEPNDYFFVDPSKMKEAKKSFTKRLDVPLISTNDVLTSWFMNQVCCHYGFMAINWRNRLEGHTEAHAGNYTGLIFYDKEDFASPGLIRKSLKSYERFVTKDKKKFPSWWMKATSTYAIVTNWTSFSVVNEIEGCEEDLHVPIIETCSPIRQRVALLVIFRMGNGRIGLCCPRNVTVGENPSFIITKYKNE